MTSLRSQIEALWFEPGTAADAAAAANKHLPRVRWVSPARVRQMWAEGQRAGRLPLVPRNDDGSFGDPETTRLMRHLGEVMTRRRAAA